MMSTRVPGKERVNNICGKEDSTCVVLEVRDYGMRGKWSTGDMKENRE